MSLKGHSRPRAFRFLFSEIAAKRGGENVDEQADEIGFLGSDGVLYCSRACALRKGFTGYEVDQDEYESLVEGESVSAGGLCPGCGAEFAISWPDREQS